MDARNVYEERIRTHGGNKRNAALQRELRYIDMHLPDNLSYTTVTVYPAEYGYNITDKEMASHAFKQDVSIINSDNLNEKSMISMPGEDIELGALIFWMGNHWLVTERDANTTVYTKTKLLQCNHLLRWLNRTNDGVEIMEQWSVVEDGTKYLTGELEDRNFVTTRGDSRISLQLSRNKYTVALNRENRFLIDDPDSPHKLSYQLTKPLKRGLVYNEQGTMKFVLQEVTATGDDNHELGIADYYKYFPRESDGENTSDDSGSQGDGTSGRRVWL